MAADQVVGRDLGGGQVAVLVVALQEREPELDRWTSGSKRVTSATPTIDDDEHDHATAASTTARAAALPQRDDRVEEQRVARRRRRTRRAGRRPRLARARAGGRSWSATPSSPHGSPPSGNRSRSASTTTQTAATSHGDRRPRHANKRDDAPGAARGTRPREHERHDGDGTEVPRPLEQRSRRTRARTTKPYERGTPGRRAPPRPEQRHERDERERAERRAAGTRGRRGSRARTAAPTATGGARRHGGRSARGSGAVAAEHPLLVGELVARQHEEARGAEELARAAGHDLASGRRRGRRSSGSSSSSSSSSSSIVAAAVFSWSSASSGASTSSGCSSSSRSRTSSSSSSSPFGRRRAPRPRGRRCRRRPRRRRRPSTTSTTSSRSSSTSRSSRSSSSTSSVLVELLVVERRRRRARRRRPRFVLECLRRSSGPVLAHRGRRIHARPSRPCRSITLDASAARNRGRGSRHSRDASAIGARDAAAHRRSGRGRPRRPLGPLFGPACPAGGLFRRSLLGLLGPAPPTTGRSARRPGAIDSKSGAPAVRRTRARVSSELHAPDLQRRERIRRSGRRPGAVAATAVRRRSLGGPLRREPLEVVVGVVDVAHRGGERAVARLLLDEPVHLLAHAAVRRVALRRASAARARASPRGRSSASRTGSGTRARPRTARRPAAGQRARRTAPRDRSIASSNSSGEAGVVHRRRDLVAVLGATSACHSIVSIR